MSPAILHMSIGMDERWQAKTVFIMGMYWCARSPDTLRMSMRAAMGCVEVVVEGSLVACFEEGEEERICCLLI